MMRIAAVALMLVTLGGCATSSQWANDFATDTCRSTRGCYVTERPAGGPPHSQAIDTAPRR